jgi:hypothetical protein
LEEHFTKETDDPIFLSTDPRAPPPPNPGGVASPPTRPETKRSDLFKASMLDLGGAV